MARFQAKVELGGKTGTGIEVPSDIVDTFGGGKRPAVHVTINGYHYRSTVAAMGGRFMLPVSAEHRSAAGVAAGEAVDVALELDTAPREVTVPPDLAAALNEEPDAHRLFDALSYSNKRRHVLAIEDAKTPETRQRRIARAVATFRDGRS